MCVPRIKETISLSKEKKVHLTWMLEWRQNWWTAVITRPARVRSVVTAAIIDVGRLGLNGRESTTIHNCALIGALHVMNVGRMERYNDKRRFQQTAV